MITDRTERSDQRQGKKVAIRSAPIITPNMTVALGTAALGALVAGPIGGIFGAVAGPLARKLYIGFTRQYSSEGFSRKG
jgi:hypothetical protein